MAGICNQFANEDRFVILTTEANHFVEEIHNRMPVVIPKDKIREWLFHSDDVDNILFGTHPPLEKQLIV
jgi:putative SOS response-associated peptidase YedK